MQFIDSTIVTLAFTLNEKSEKCRDIIRNGGIINSLVLVESFSNIERITKSRRLAIGSIKSILGCLEVAAVDQNILFESLRRAERYNKLKIFDLIHYTTALLSGCSSIVSYDKDFEGLEIKREEP